MKGNLTSSTGQKFEQCFLVNNVRKKCLQYGLKELCLLKESKFCCSIVYIRGSSILRRKQIVRDFKYAYKIHVTR